MTKKDLLAQYGFDIEKFFQSDYFADGLKFFETSIENGLTKEIPAFVKEHGEEKAEDALTSYDGKNGVKVKDVVNRYTIAIKDSLRYLHDTRTNDKFYKLISYDGTVFEAESQLDINRKLKEQEKAEQEKFEAELDNAIEEALKEIYK